MPRRHRFRTYAGKLRPLAVTTATRLEVLPDVPTVGDFVPGYEASSWLGFGAPKNMSAAVLDRLNKEINLAISDSAIKARLVDLGGLVLSPNSPAEFGKFLASDTESGRGSFEQQTSNQSSYLNGPANPAQSRPLGGGDRKSFEPSEHFR